MSTYRYLPGLEPNDGALVAEWFVRLRDSGWTGPPIVVLDEPDDAIVWIVSDPHRHAAALALSIAPVYIRLEKVFEEARLHLPEALDEADKHAVSPHDHSLPPADAVRKRERRMVPGTNYWWDMVLDAFLPHDVKAKYWSEQGDGRLPLGYSGIRPAPGPRLA